MTSYGNIDYVVVTFKDREGVPAAITIDGSQPESDLLASINVSDDGLTATVRVDGLVANSSGYAFRSLEDWELRWIRRADEPYVAELGQGVKKRQELGRVGKIVVSVAMLAILSPLVVVLWDATLRWVGR